MVVSGWLFLLLKARSVSMPCHLDHLPTGVGPARADFDLVPIARGAKHQREGNRARYSSQGKERT
jgi:hypothetical protein